MSDEVSQHLLAIEQEQRRADDDDAQYRRLAQSLEQQLYEDESLKPPRVSGPPNPLVQPHVDEEQQMPLLSQPQQQQQPQQRQPPDDDEGQPGPGDPKA